MGNLTKDWKEGERERDRERERVREREREREGGVGERRGWCWFETKNKM